MAKGEYTYNKILEKAKEVVKNVEKEHKLGMGDTWGYYFAEALLTPKKNIKRFTFTNAPKPKGDYINTKVTRSEYKQLAKDLIAFVKKKKRMRNYLDYKGQRIRARLYVYLLAKAIITNASKIKINYKIFYTESKSFKKYGRSDEYGCDNMGQNNSYYCGPHMIQEIIRNLTGKVISQSTLASIIGTTTEGSDHQGLNTVIAWFNNKYGFDLKVEWKNFSDLGWSGIKKILESSNQDCGVHELYRDTWGHYTNFDRIYDDTIDVHNSLGDSCSSGCYCGYVENRYKSTAKSYIGGISQKSILIVTNN